MVFAHQLQRLRASLECGREYRTSVSHGVAVSVRIEDLRELLRHFDRLDSDARINADLAQKHPRVIGISTMFDNPRALLMLLVEKPGDDAMRAIHERLRRP